MNKQQDNDPLESLVTAYEKLLEQVHEAASNVEHATMPGLKKMVAQASEKLVALGELSHEESQKISAYLHRDISDAAHHLRDEEANLANWLRFDLSLIEDRLLEMFTSVADKTSLGLLQLQQQAHEASLYHTGEITGPGTLYCCQCDKPLHFTKTGHIPPCSECKTTRFKREPEKMPV